MAGLFFIAEAGVNHNGSLERALALVQAAAEAGADAVKFQTFKAEAVAAQSARKAAYQARETGAEESQLAMLKALELSEEEFVAVDAQCRRVGIEFMSTPFDLGSLDLLVRRLGVRRLKVPSGEITNGPFLLAMARSGLPIILSTGMADLEEIADALAVLAFGYTAGPREPASLEEMRKHAETPLAKEALERNVWILHCTSAYPAPMTDLNLLAMRTIAERFGLPVGYSDHSLGTHVGIAAAALGAVAIEKHFTLDRSLPGPDHKASLEPGELAALITQVRDICTAIGQPHKRAMPSEEDTRIVARRSLVAIEDIPAGTPFSMVKLGSLRPANGLSPMAWWDVQGRRAARDLQRGETIGASALAGGDNTKDVKAGG